MSPAFAPFLPILVPAIIASIFALIIWGSITQARKARENLQKLGSQLGLALEEPTRKNVFTLSQSRLLGSLRGRTVEIFSYTTGSGKNRTTWCAAHVRAAIRPGFELKISGENFVTKAGKMFGMQNIEFGDPAFDDKFFLKTKQESFVRAAIIPEVRMRMVEAWTQHGGRGTFTVDERGVKYAETGTFANAKICARFPAMLEIACDLAEIGETWSGD